MPKVVVNSTPLIVLCGIDRLDILRKMYQEVCLPNAVYYEVIAKQDSACQQIKSAGSWLCVKDIKDHSEKKMFKAKLHAGEVEVMLLALEQNADLVIIDDNAAKKTAKYLGIKTTGTLGVLLKAKRQGFVERIQPLLLAMKKNGFYVSDDLSELVLQQAGEL